MAWRIPDNETRQVYQVGWSLSACMPDPNGIVLRDHKALRAYVDKVTAHPIFKGTTIHLAPASSRMGGAKGGWVMKRALPTPSHKKWENKARSGVLTWEQAKDGYHAEHAAWSALPWTRWYHIRVPAYMRTFWYVTHELAHVLHFIENENLRHGGHGHDFRNTWVRILDAHHPDLAAMLRANFDEKGLSHADAN